jgi:hypothetical protein
MSLGWGILDEVSDAYSTYVLVQYILVKTPEGKRQFERTRRKWEDNIRTDIKIGREGVNWILLYQDVVQWQALVNAEKIFAFHNRRGNVMTTVR